MALGHRRLSIIDLDERANQPLSCDTGRYTIVFNGEIYNYAQLRDDLVSKGRVLKTTSDTEVVLHLYAAYGPAFVSRLRGMFAFAIWDNTEESLLLGRDPYGIKPLYTSNDGWHFRFASQVKALLAGGGVSRAPEPAGVVGFYLWGSVPEPFTLYRDIRSFPPGHTQYVDRAGPRMPVSYASIADEFAVSDESRGERDHGGFKTALLESVRAHLVADVEVGLFLSAGVDSGALLGLMRDAGQEKIRTITISFEEFAGTPEDEAPIAADIARYYGADHTNRVIGMEEFADAIPTVLEAMDQPSIDGFNTYFVAKAARELGLKVALSGVGGDELLGGYPSFDEIPRWVNWIGPTRVLPGLGVGARLIGSLLGMAKASPKRLGLLEYGGSFEGAYLLRRGLFLPFELNSVLDRDLISCGLRRLKPLARIARDGLRPSLSSGRARVAALESTNYLRNQLLRDADWAGMAHGLEIRTPLVDFDLLRAVRASAVNADPGQGKANLANAPSACLPDKITRRPKTGFVVPTQRLLPDVSNATNLNTKGQMSRQWAKKIAVGFAIPTDLQRTGQLAPKLQRAGGEFRALSPASTQS